MVQGQEVVMGAISWLAKAGGVGVETIRYYQRRGLLSVPDRPMGGVRRYDDEDVRKLRFIRTAQVAGFTLEEIGELLALDASQDRQRAQDMARRRIAILDEQIVAMTAARGALSRLAKACSAEPNGPCPILNAFQPASRETSPSPLIPSEARKRIG